MSDEHAAGLAIAWLEREILRLRAENERLRALLRDLLDGDESDGPEQRARAALEEK